MSAPKITFDSGVKTPESTAPKITFASGVETPESRAPKITFSNGVQNRATAPTTGAATQAKLLASVKNATTLPVLNDLKRDITQTVEQKAMQEHMDSTTPSQRLAEVKSAVALPIFGDLQEKEKQTVESEIPTLVQANVQNIDDKISALEQEKSANTGNRLQTGLTVAQSQAKAKEYDAQIDELKNQKMGIQSDYANYLNQKKQETPQRALSVIKGELTAAKAAEQSAMNKLNEYMLTYSGALDMPGRAEELQALKDAATAATSAREELEKEYNNHSGSFEDQFGEYSGVEKAAMGIIGSPLYAMDVIGQTAKSALTGDNSMDMDTLAMQNYKKAQQLKSSATENLSGAGKFLADTGISIAQNLYGLPMNVIAPGASLAVMGAGAAADKMVDVGDSGGSATSALVRGAVSGGIEALTEKLPLDSLADLVKTGGKTVVKNLLKQGGVEATEEGLSYVMNYIADKAAKDPDAEWDWAEFANSVASGGLSGLFFGLGGTAVNRVNGTISGLPIANQNSDTSAQQPATLPIREQVNTDATGTENAVEGVSEQNKTASTGETEYRAVKPENVEMPTVPIINLSMQNVADLNGGELPDAGNKLRKAAIDRAKTRLGLDENSAAYIPASNVMRNGEEYVLKITKASLNKMLSPADHGVIPAESIVVMDNLERIANNGVWFDGQGDRLARDQILGVDHLKTTVYIDNAPYEVDMRVRIVQETPNADQNNVLYYLTPEEILTVKKVDTNSPTVERRAPNITSENVSTSNTNILDNESGVKNKFAQNAQNNAENQVHIDDRMHEDASNRKVNAFQFDNPEIHPYYADAARALLYDLNNSVKGERFTTGAEDYGGQQKWTGVKRHTTELLAEYLDNSKYHLSYDSLRQALENIIQDKGHENYAAAKRAEFILDDMLTNGWTDIDGEFTAANQDYINAKESLKQTNGPRVLPVREQEGVELPVKGREAQSMAMQAEGNEELVDGYGQNTVGAAQAQFPYQEAPSQSVADRMFTEQEMQDHDLESKHQVFTNAQGRADAEMLLAYDYEGEVERLKSDEWGPVENVEGHKILENLVEQARKTGTAEDWAKVKEWKKLYDQKGGTEAGQTLQSRAQFANSAATITSEAADFLDSNEAKKLKDGKKQQILDEVAKQSEALENTEKGDLEGLISLIERNSEIRRTTGLFNKTTSKQMDWALHKIAELYPDAEGFLRGVAASQARAIYTDYAKVSVTERLKSLRVQNMLSKPSTIMRNLVSNNIFDPLETLSNDVGLVFDVIMSKATGQRTTALEKSWASKAKRHGSLEGALKSFVEVGLDADSNAGYSYNGIGNLENANAENASSIDHKGEDSIYAPGTVPDKTKKHGSSGGKYEGTSGGRTFKMTGNFLERFLSTWSKYQNYTLTTTDEFQKGGIRAETQESIDKLKQAGKLDADSLNEWADETAKQRTFQNDSVPAELMEGARDTLNKLHVKDVGAGDILVPFARVPGNLVDQAFNYSPVGMVNGAKQMVQVMLDAKNGNYSAEAQAQAARNIGRGLSGTGLLALFAAAAAKGLIKVAGADDKDKEALEKAQGKTGTQWNLSATMRGLNGESTEWQDGDTLMSIGFLDPINSIMAAGSFIADAYKEDGTLTAEDVADASFSALFQSVLDLPAMSSISDLIDAYTYADGETTAEKAGNAALDYAAGEVESFLIPNALRGIATGLDDTVRNRYAGETFGESVKEGIVSGLPIARENLPASLDPFGREKTQTGNTVMNMLNNNLLPGALTKYKETDVEKTLETVYDATGNASIYPDKSAPSSFNVDGEKFTLDAEQKDEFMTTAGATALEIMMDMIASENFQMMNEQTQSEYLALANEYARAIAKVEVTDGKYEPTGTSAKIAAAEDAGMSAADYIMAKLNSSGYNEDGEGTMTIGENAQYVRNSGMSQKEQEIYWCILYPEWPEKAEEKGVELSDYIKYKTAVYGVEGDKNAKGDTISGSKKKNMIAALVDAGYSETEARKLYEAINKSS